MIERAKFEHQLDQLRIIILDGLSYYIVWLALDQEYQDSLRTPAWRTGFGWRYRGFLAPARKALFFATVMEISKAFDTRQKTVSIPGLLMAACESQNLVSVPVKETLKAILDRVYDSQDLLTRLRRLRNKRLAHFDPTFRDHVDLPSGDLHHLVEETKSMHNTIQSACGRNPDDFDDIMADVSRHTSEVLAMISQSSATG